MILGHRGVISSTTRAGGEPEKQKLSVATGLAGLSLDAMASVSYGPEAIVLVLALAGGAGIGFTVPVTIAIAVLLVVLVASYRQVIAVFPEGGGAYAVAKKHLSPRASLTAAASLIVDYTLNVAVSIAAGVAALTSAFPALLPYTVWIALAILGGITALNLRGIADSARVFMLPTAVFVVSVFTVIGAGLLRENPAAATAPFVVDNAHTIGILLLLKAFSSGCAALTGVEAIANAVPSFKKPRVRSAQRAEVALGILLGTMLIGLAVLIEKFSLAPVPGTTVLSQLTSAALGNGVGYYVVQFSTVILLALAANTSYGGLPNLMRILAEDNVLPHRFSRKSTRDVFTYGVLSLGGVGALLLIGSGGNMNTLVPLFAIGVFIGFTLAQFGMVRHWLAEQTPGWKWRLALNGFGAALTSVAAVVTTAMKFTEGAWLIALALPALVLGMERIRGAYTHIGTRLTVQGENDSLSIGYKPAVLVPVSEITSLSTRAMAAATAMSSQPIAIRVCLAHESTTDFTRRWQARHPNSRLIVIEDTENSVGNTLARYIRTHFPHRETFVVVATIDPATRWHRILPSQRTDEIAHALRKHTEAVVCQIPVRIDPAHRDPALRA
ncbi:Amino acid transporter [Rhodococcus erythropolis]|uniref:APC family permease n=1 Tax=Rhodococcus erythropolis TaxID=1833 RepID=UPI0008773057|nr:APC family permease [Rhodococcus erythropolis]SCY64869.1 Amino acid transporter [Rhodococcus erythropolis]